MILLHKAKVVAEIGATHLGSMDRAKELIRLARICNAPYVKLQKRNPDESTPEHMKDKPHPNQMFAYGKTYLEHRKALELSIDQHAELQEYCNKIGIIYTTSVWDVTSAREVIGLNPPFIKVPSACNNNQEMLKILFEEYSGDVHVSTGMSTRAEIIQMTDTLKPWSNRVVVYHCTSEYPCSFEHLYLLEIVNLRKNLPKGMSVGFSNHGRGIAADVAAYTLGAEWIERHFIDDRLIRHTDAAASLEPGGLSKLVRDLNAIYLAARYKTTDLTDEEKQQRNKLKTERK